MKDEQMKSAKRPHFQIQVVQLQKGPDVKLGWKPYGSNLLNLFLCLPALSVTFPNCIKRLQKNLYLILVKQILCITICIIWKTFVHPNQFYKFWLISQETQYVSGKRRKRVTGSFVATEHLGGSFQATCVTSYRRKNGSLT